MLTAKQNFSPSPGTLSSNIAVVAFPRQVRRPSSGSGHTSRRPSVVDSVKISSTNLSSNPYSALKTAPDHLNLRQTCPKVTTCGTPALLKPANPDHKYWCTVCDNRSFQHSDGWKKHEKEHEVKYVCMLKGLFEFTKDGRRCVLCGALNQGDSHHLVHNTTSCIKATNRPSVKRRYDMVGHLKDVHAIYDRTKAGSIADKWRCRSSKNAWSCGFCIHLSRSLQDHLRHIGIEHFEKGQSITDWNYSNIIQGLLQQPAINEAWMRLLESLDPFRPSETRWNKSGSEMLLYKLERRLTGNDTPQSLAKAAYDSAEFDWNCSNIDITTSTTATDNIPNQLTSKGLSCPVQNDTFRSEEGSVQCQPWPPAPYQASQIPRSTPDSKTQGTAEPAFSSPSPARLLPTLDYSPRWEPLTSDIDDRSTTQPTTPFNGQQLYPADPLVFDSWSSNNITPDPAYGNKEILHYNSNYKTEEPTNIQSDIDIHDIRFTLKRPRNSVSPPPQTRPHQNLFNDRPGKKPNRQKSWRNGMGLRSFDADYGQVEGDGDDGIRSQVGANGYPKDDLYGEGLLAINDGKQTFARRTTYCANSLTAINEHQNQRRRIRSRTMNKVINIQGYMKGGTGTSTRRIQRASASGSSTSMA